MAYMIEPGREVDLLVGLIENEFRDSIDQGMKRANPELVKSMKRISTDKYESGIKYQSGIVCLQVATWLYLLSNSDYDEVSPSTFLLDLSYSLAEAAKVTPENFNRYLSQIDGI